MNKYRNDQLDVENINIIKLKRDIYRGTENLAFQERHPIYKSLMKIEFEDVLRTYHKDK